VSANPHCFWLLKHTDRCALLLALEVQERNLFRLEGALSNLHSDAVNEVVAMSLNDEATLSSNLMGEETPQFRLSARVKMNFRLLEKKRHILGLKNRVHKNGE